MPTSRGERPLLLFFWVAAATAASAPAQPPGSEAEPPRARAAPRPEALDALDRYTGHWRSDDKTDRQGDPFHFEYDLAWLDPDRTIARMVITRVTPEGRTVVFEGYKGREPAGDGVYYFGVSPSGRGGRGEVVVEDGALVTVYDGWTSQGDVVRIRDVFEPPSEDGDTFVSRTFLRPAADAEWRRVAEDRWRRADAPR